MDSSFAATFELHLHQEHCHGQSACLVTGIILCCRHHVGEDMMGIMHVIGHCCLVYLVHGQWYCLMTQLLSCESHLC